MYIENEDLAKIKADIQLAINELKETTYKDFMPQMKADAARLDLERAVRLIDSIEDEANRILEAIKKRDIRKAQAFDKWATAKAKVDDIKAKMSMQKTMVGYSEYVQELRTAVIELEWAHKDYHSI